MDIKDDDPLADQRWMLEYADLMGEGVRRLGDRLPELLRQQALHWYEPNGTPRVMGCACSLCVPSIT